ncbi:MAG: hypothetical protein PUE03_02950, partial [Prevotella sp.]|nr:hypothetical protein [Prevotella sp.]
VINGDITSPELTVGHSRRLYQGTATVILRAQREAGNITLHVNAPGLKEKTLRLSTVASH